MKAYPGITKITRLFSIFMFTTLLITQALNAQGRRGGGPGGEGMAERMKAQVEEVVAKLELGDEKAETVRGILEKEAEERIALFQGFSGNQDRSARQAMREEMETIQKNTREELAGILSEEELEKYDKIQAEMRERRRGQGRRGQPRVN